MGLVAEIIEEKVCTKCGKSYPNTPKYFYWKNKNEQILRPSCKECGKEYGKEYGKKYYIKNKEKKKEYDKEYRIENKEYKKEYGKKYYIKNKEYKKEYGKKYYIKNKEKRKEYDKEYRIKNKEYKKEYRIKNKEKIKEYDKEYKKAPALFNSYKYKLTIDEDPIKGPNGELLVKCTYCGKHFQPTNGECQNRIRSLNGTSSGEGRLYCSDGCKQACPVFNRALWPKGFKPATSREVDPLIRKMCLKLDDYTCQLCEKTIDEIELHCHHEKGVRQNPIFQNDVDNTITLCKKCHKWVHKQPGCSYYDLRCDKEKPIMTTA